MRSSTGLFLIWLFSALSTFSQPALKVDVLGGNEIQISWPAAPGGFALEHAAALGNAVTWQLVNTPPVVQNNVAAVSLPLSNAAEFFRLNQSSLTSITESSPLDGETGVSVTRETIVHFSNPLAANAVVTTNNFYAIATGRRILSRIELSSDHTRASLFYLEPLPGSARVTVFFDGQNLTDALGRTLDPDGDGLAGGVKEISFDTLSLTALGGTAVIGTVYASELAPGPGTGTNGVNKPLAGVTITVDGMEQTLRTVTDASGNFILNPVPPGRFFVHIDGRTAVNDAEGIHYPDKAYYPYVGKAWDAAAGETNNLAGGTGKIYLPLITAGTLQPVSLTADTTISFPPNVISSNPALSGVNITVPANSLFSDDGTRGGKVGIAPVPPDRLPGPLPDGANLPLVITVQTDGALNFDQPAPVCFPNLPDPVTGKPWPPGAKGTLISFNHKKGTWEPVGGMTVSPDGKLFCTDPGVGIIQPGWHGVQTPPPQGPPPPPPDDQCPRDETLFQLCLESCQQQFLDCQAEGEKVVTSDRDLVVFYLANNHDDLAKEAQDRYLADMAYWDRLCNDLLRECTDHCQSCYALGGQDQKIASHAAFASGARQALAQPADEQTVLTQLAGLSAQVRQIFATAVAEGRALNATEAAQVRGLIAQADSAAGGNENDYLTQLAISHETTLSQMARSLGREPEDLVLGNAPAYPIDYAARVLRPSGLVTLRGQTEPRGQYFIYLPPDGELINVDFYDRKTKQYASITPNASADSKYALPRFTLRPLSSDQADLDKDGLPDVVESVIGTNPGKADTDGDGIPDGPELNQGTDPLDGSPVRTGVIATVKTPGAAVDVWAGNDLVVTAEGVSGVSILSAFTGSNPTILAHITTPGPVPRVAGTTGFIVAAMGDAGAAIIDISNPAAARVASKVTLQGVNAVTADEGIAYLGLASGQIYSVDLASGLIIGRVSITGTVQDLALAGDDLYAVTTDTLFVLSHANGVLKVLGSVASPYVDAPNQRLFVGGGVAYTVHRKGCNTIDVTNPAQPLLLSAANTAQFGWREIVANGSGIGLAAVGPNSTDDGPHDISLYDLTNPKVNNTVITTLPTPGNARAVAIYNGLGYVADDTAGLQVLNYLPYDAQGVPPKVTLVTSFGPAGVEEGQAARATASVSDDVQVRNVEFYIDGTNVFTDGAFPFEFRFVTPSVTAGKTSFVLRARAIDTGGNAAWSDEISVPLLPDTTPPQVIKVAPPTARRMVDSVLAFFDEPINPDTLNAQSFEIFSAGPDGQPGTADDVRITNGAVSYTAATRTAALAFPEPLPENAAYHAVLTTAITDRAGNKLAADYTWNFRTTDAVFASSFEGGTNAPAGSTLNGDAVIETTGGVNNSGVLKLTKTINGQWSSFVIDDMDAGTPVYGYDLTAKVRIGGATGTAADGFSIYFDPTANQNTKPNFPEEGGSAGLSVSFDIFDNGFETPAAPSIDVRWNNVVIATKHVEVSGLETGTDFVNLHARLEPDGTFSLAWKDSTVFTNVVIPNFQPVAGASFVFAARTGGYNENQWFDDINITTFTIPNLVITQQPSSRIALSGRSVAFAVGVNFPDAAKYQWLKNGIAIPGATNAVLVLENLASEDDGAKLQAIASAGDNRAASDEASLTVVHLNPQIDFNFNDGQLPAGTQVFGTGLNPANGKPFASFVDSSGGVDNSGVLKLILAVNNLQGTFLTAPLLSGGAVSGITAAFDVRMDGGTSLPADGFSFNVASGLPEGPAQSAEEGVGQGLSIAFDIWDNGSETPPAPSIDVRYKGQVVNTTHLPFQDIVTGDAYRTVLVHVTPDGKLDLVYGDKILAAGVQLPNFAPVTNANAGFYARTGGSYENIWIDNVQIEAMPANP